VYSEYLENRPVVGRSYGRSDGWVGWLGL